MEDLILRLYPYPLHENGPALQAVDLADNRERLFEVQKASEHDASPSYSRESRESTVPWDDDDDPHPEDSIGRRGLQLTFSNRPKRSFGYLLGTDRDKCDIVLPKLRGISREHCYFWYDSSHRLLLTDYSSRYGTKVRYHQNGGDDFRRKFTWIVGGDEISRSSGVIIVQLGDIKFQIDVVVPSLPDVYRQNVLAFLRKAESHPALDLSILGIKSTATTAAPTGAQTPRQDPILLKHRRLGKGTFAEVHQAWDVSTGDEYAVKKFFTVKELKDGIRTWEMEAALLGNCCHDHIVRLHFTTESPEYQLVMEYVPLGHLASQNDEEEISKDETRTLLQQGLDALSYLHSMSPPIAHRDLKPENILIQSRRPLHIKLGDFGLSRAGNDLETFCGSPKYVAPEITPTPHRPAYSCAVDIWSLGVLALEYAFGLPEWRGWDPRSGIWCRRLSAHVRDLEKDDFANLLSCMIDLDGKARPTARACLERAGRVIPTPAKTSPSASLAVTCADTAENTTLNRGIRHPVENQRVPNKRKRRSSLGVVPSIEAKSCTATQRKHNKGPSRSEASMHKATSEGVLNLLRSICIDETTEERVDAHTKALLQNLCQRLERMGVTKICANAESRHEMTTVVGFVGAEPIPLASMAYEDRATSMADLANHLLRSDGPLCPITSISKTAHGHHESTHADSLQVSPPSLQPRPVLSVVDLEQSTIGKHTWRPCQLSLPSIKSDCSIRSLSSNPMPVTWPYSLHRTDASI